MAGNDMAAAFAVASSKSTLQTFHNELRTHHTAVLIASMDFNMVHRKAADLVAALVNTKRVFGDLPENLAKAQKLAEIEPETAAMLVAAIRKVQESSTKMQRVYSEVVDWHATVAAASRKAEQDANDVALLMKSILDRLSAALGH
jgi:hypothetical protein